jgi:hypothetical protein
MHDGVSSRGVPVGRAHLFEFEDFAWFPARLRDYETDGLQFFINTFGFYDTIAPILEGLIQRSTAAEVVDLCSGGSGPWITLKPSLEARLERPLKVTLTDKFPNLKALGRARELAGVEYEEQSVEATKVPEALTGVRTLFSSFHHFPPDMAAAILRDAWERRVPIGVFEITARTPLDLLRYLLAPLAILFWTPFIRPLRLGRFVFTYLIPLVPLIGLWDGFASCMRTYSPQELEALVADLQAEGYEWEAGRKFRWCLPSVTYLVGRPVA